MTLRIYGVTLELVARLAKIIVVLRGKSPNLADQLERAAQSIPLNVAEGAYSRGRNRTARYQTALGSARESLACLETARAFGWLTEIDAETNALFRHVIGTLVKLVKN